MAARGSSKELRGLASRPICPPARPASTGQASRPSFAKPVDGSTTKWNSTDDDVVTL